MTGTLSPEERDGLTMWGRGFAVQHRQPEALQAGELALHVDDEAPRWADGTVVIEADDVSKLRELLTAIEERERAMRLAGQAAAEQWQSHTPEGGPPPGPDDDQAEAARRAWHMDQAAVGNRSELVIFVRRELQELMGELALPPWRLATGHYVGGDIDCAPLAASILGRLDALEVRVTPPLDDLLEVETYTRRVRELDEPVAVLHTARPREQDPTDEQEEPHA